MAWDKIEKYINGNIGNILFGLLTVHDDSKKMMTVWDKTMLYFRIKRLAYMMSIIAHNNGKQYFWHGNWPHRIIVFSLLHPNCDNT